MYILWSTAGDVDCVEKGKCVAKFGSLVLDDEVIVAGFTLTVVRVAADGATAVGSAKDIDFDVRADCDAKEDDKLVAEEFFVDRRVITNNLAILLVSTWGTDIGTVDVNADKTFDFGGDEVGSSVCVVECGVNIVDSIDFSVVSTDGLMSDDADNVFVIVLTTSTVTYAISFTVPLSIRKVHWPLSAMLTLLMINVPFSIT